MVTPSHNPPDNGGFKYNPPNGGPADTDITGWIEDARQRVCSSSGLSGVKRVRLTRALRPHTTHRHDYLDAYVSDLDTVIDLDGDSRRRPAAWASIRWAAPACITGRASPSAMGWI